MSIATSYSFRARQHLDPAPRAGCMRAPPRQVASADQISARTQRTESSLISATSAPAVLPTGVQEPTGTSAPNPNVVYAYLPTSEELAAAQVQLRDALQAKREWAEGRYRLAVESGSCTPEQLEQLQQHLWREVRAAEDQYAAAMAQIDALYQARSNAACDAAIAATNAQQALYTQLLSDAKAQAVVALRAASIAESAIPAILQQLEAEFYQSVTQHLNDGNPMTSFTSQVVPNIIGMHLSAMRADMANTGISEAEWRARQRPEP